MSDRDTRHRRILQITEQIVSKQVELGMVDPDNEDELRKAVRIAAQTAKSAYDAALEFISG